MEYILICESMILLFFLCRLLNTMSNMITRLGDKKPLKIDLRKPFSGHKHEETEQERKERLLLENIDNYGTEKAQQDIK